MGSLFEATLPQLWVETPLIKSAALSKAAGCRIFLKLENLQPSGSFKSRGIGNLLLNALRTHPHPHLTHFYSSSGGNAGLACVTAALTLGRPATVVVPLSTSSAMISKLRLAGATAVIQYGPTWVDADAYLRREILSQNPYGVYVPPFDHPDVWAGAATLVGEVEKQLEGERPDAVVCSVGGGGLLCGIIQGLEERWGRGAVDVLAMETKGADSLARSLEKDHLVTLPAITSIATSLGAARVAAHAFELVRARPHVVVSAVLSDTDAVMGCWQLADEERLLVEPACGVSVAVCFGGRLRRLLPGLNGGSRVVIVVCGGSNVGVEALVEWRKVYGGVEGCVGGNVTGVEGSFGI